MVRSVSLFSAPRIALVRPKGAEKILKKHPAVLIARNKAVAIANYNLYINRSGPFKKSLAIISASIALGAFLAPKLNLFSENTMFGVLFLTSLFVFPSLVIESSYRLSLFEKVHQFSL